MKTTTKGSYKEKVTGALKRKLGMETAKSTPMFSQRLNAIHDAFDREEAKQKQTSMLQKAVKFSKTKEPTDAELDKKYGPTSDGVGVGH